MKTLSLLIFTLLMPILLNGQTSKFNSRTDVNLSRSIELNDFTGTKEITISVDEEILTLYLQIEANVQHGLIEIEVIKPSNKKKWSINVGTQIEDKPAEKMVDKSENKINETVNGIINKTINDPEKGNWIIRFKANQTTAHFRIKSQMTEQED